jgi:adenylate cyclase
MGHDGAVNERDGRNGLEGLVDPSAPDADAQRSLAAFLVERGVPIEQVRDATGDASMAELVAGAVLWPDLGLIDASELAARAGVPEDVTRRARRILGFVDPGDDAACRSREVEMIQAFGAGAALFGEDRTLQMARVLGTSTAAIAEAANALFTGAIGAPLRAAGVTDAEFGLTARDAMLAFESVCVAVDVMLRLHFERAVARLGGELTVDELTYAIAFVDVVDSTVLAGELEGGELAVALRDFDRITAEAAVRNDVRLVKLIGDGAMLAARDAPALARSVAEVVAAVGDHMVLPAAKGGVTFGDVATHDGDYFGQVVNLAARASSAAAPGEVLVDANAAAQLAGLVEPAGSYHLKGFGEPVELYRLTGAIAG